MKRVFSELTVAVNPAKRQRGSAVAYHTRSQRPTLTGLYRRQVRATCWIAATKTRNFMLNDTLVDWLALKDRSWNPRGKRGKKIENDSFLGYIMRRGCEFEEELVKHINANQTPIVKVSEKITPETVAETKRLMMSGVPVIHSAPVRNPDDGTQGVIDLLVRSDYLQHIVETCPLTDEEQVIKAPNLNGDYHYVVIDVKFSTLPLRSNGVTLLNSGSYPAYKAQCLIYTDAIGRIQGYTSRYAYIMGRRWKYTSKDVAHHNLTCIDRLGVIDYTGWDKPYVQRTKDALKWVRDLHTEGKNWSVSPPTRDELYPNMCVKGVWDSEKKQIADDLAEITSLWYCGVKNRQKAFDNNVKSWRDPRCTSDTIGQHGVRGSTIDAMLEINRQDDIKISPAVIKNDAHEWKSDVNEVYVDFEMFTDLFAPFNEIPHQRKTDMMFMIGVYHRSFKDPDVWTYTSFIAKEATYDEEFRIMDEFTGLIADLGNPKLWYWFAEKRQWNTSECRQFDRAKQAENFEEKAVMRSDHISDNWSDLDWCDLMDVFKQEPVVLKDCFAFGLKEISAAMRKHGMITTKIDSECDNGLKAMIKAWDCYKSEENPDKCAVMKDIEVYNKFDCKVLWDMHTYLRENHRE